MNSAPIPFHSRTAHLGTCDLLPLDPQSAHWAAKSLAAMDPWKRLGYREAGLLTYLTRQDPGLSRYLLTLGKECAGAVCIRYPWLRGPFLELIAVMDGFQGKGIGNAVLGWMEKEARGVCANLWVSVSSFNDRALTFYLRQGFSEATILKDLLREGEVEILLRKRVSGR